MTSPSSSGSIDRVASDSAAPGSMNLQRLHTTLENFTDLVNVRSQDLQARLWALQDRVSSLEEQIARTRSANHNLS